MSRDDEKRLEHKLELLKSYRRKAHAKSVAQLTVEWADSVLKSPLRLPPMPALAKEHVARMAELRANPKAPPAAEAHVKQRRWQYDRWLADVVHEVCAHGLRVVQELDKYAPRDANRLNAMSARVATLLGALRDLQLAWWPVHRIDDDHNELSLLDHCERELGRLEGLQVKRLPARPVAPKLNAEGWF